MENVHQCKGKLIAIEGMDGSGKSTMIEYMGRYLKECNFTHNTYRQPEGVYRDMLLKTFGHPRLAYDRAVLAMLSRRRTIHEALHLAQDIYDVILTDRFNFSTYCIHGIYEDQLGLINAMAEYDRYGFLDMHPAATIYLSCPADVCYQRKMSSKKNQYEETVTPFDFAKLHKIFEDQARLNEGERGARNGFGHVHIIDTNRDIRDVLPDLHKVINKIILTP